MANQFQKNKNTAHKNEGIKKPHGQLRMSQLLTTYGPGALLDLPKHSVIVGGTQTWYGTNKNNRPEMKNIYEERLEQKVRWYLQKNSDEKLHRIEFKTPPGANGFKNASESGISAFLFPEWFVTVTPDKNRKRRLVPLREKELKKREFTDENGQKHKMMPVRFVRVCKNGHIGDINWRFFVNCEGAGCRSRPLYLVDTGTSGDVSEIKVQCDCGNARKLADASPKESTLLGKCDGGMPWLKGKIGQKIFEPCSEHNRLLVRTSSSSYFPQIMTVISIPSDKRPISEAVSEHFERLNECETEEELQGQIKSILRDPKRKIDLEKYSVSEIFLEIENQRSSSSTNGGPKLKAAEFSVLAEAKSEIEHDVPDGDFYARSIKIPTVDKYCSRYLSGIVLVHRLREVSTLLGFSRLNAPSPDKDGELDEDVKMARIGPDFTWLPAIENRGEGIFLTFKSEMISEWQKQAKVRERASILNAGIEQFNKENAGVEKDFPGSAYTMLHSLSHLLVTAISLECGYPASSIKERIYSIVEEDAQGYGILLYTSTSDAEGTMGGLIQAGRRMEHHLTTALNMAKLCSNDPVCAQHLPNNQLEKRYTLGAACHGCLLIAETSCECRNEYLDRSLLVATVSEKGAEFFADFL
jgi:Domain of unknown function (DUF1998)